MYGDKFCKLYNELGWNYAPEAFSSILLEWLKRHHISINNSLDLGCGTGILCDILYQNGIHACGMDFSENMIKIAKARNPEISFEVADMVTYHPAESFDLVTSTEDALNHILSLEQISQVFVNVYHYLNPEGLFIFDILKDTSVIPGTEIEFDLDDQCQGKISTLQNPDGSYSLITTVHKNGILEFREEIHEKYYDPEIIIHSLKLAGFQDVLCTDCLLDDSTSPGTNWYLIARK